MDFLGRPGLRFLVILLASVAVLQGRPRFFTVLLGLEWFVIFGDFSVAEWVRILRCCQYDLVLVSDC